MMTKDVLACITRNTLAELSERECELVAAFRLMSEASIDRLLYHAQCQSLRDIESRDSMFAGGAA